PPSSTLFPYTTLFRSYVEPSTLLGVGVNAMYEAAQKVKATGRSDAVAAQHGSLYDLMELWMDVPAVRRIREKYIDVDGVLAEPRSEEHTSELQSRFDL